MYKVTVFEIGDYGTEIDRYEVKIGLWQEIAYWLDSKGYIDPRYRVMVRFTS